MSPADVNHTRDADMNTLLAHEWLSATGGSENVFEQLSLALPTANRVCLWNDAPMRFDPCSVSETWLARTPLRRWKSLSLALQPLAWSSVDLAGIDRVVASSHAFAHQLATRAVAQGKQGFAYVHTPARYIWAPDLDSRGRGIVARRAARMLRRVDKGRTSDDLRYAANSRFVRNRIRDCWDRDATVIYPPVDVSRIQAGGEWASQLSDRESTCLKALGSGFVLGASRLIGYKRLDFAIRVGELLDRPVVIAGSGPAEPELRALSTSASVPVSFVGRVSDVFLYALYQHACLYVFMAVEDFGIMPVEAMALGTPTLVNNLGGAAESVEMLKGGCSVSPSSVSCDDLRVVAEQAVQQDMTFAVGAAHRLGNRAFSARLDDWLYSRAPRDLA